MEAKAESPLVSADDEWSPLRAVIVGRAEHSAFPSEPAHMVAATMPAEHHAQFRPGNPFPPQVVAQAQRELDNLATLLKGQGIRVYRPREVNWLAAGGYTGAMPRDGLMAVGNTLIESHFSWRCRRDEVALAYPDILDELGGGRGPVRIYRAPKVVGRDTIYDGVCDGSRENGGPKGEHGNGDSNAVGNGNGKQVSKGPIEQVENKVGNGIQNGTKLTPSPSSWAINESRPAFDTADFMRFGTTIVGQLSHVTNARGFDFLRAVVLAGYRVELLRTTDPSAMHIDATILPLRRGLLVYHPGRVSEAELRRIDVFADWELHPYPFDPYRRQEQRGVVGDSNGHVDADANKNNKTDMNADTGAAPRPPMFMCSPWLVLNALSIDEKRILVEQNEVQFADWLKSKFGMEPIMCPFSHVNSIGGSFHCATVDLVRERAP